MDLTGKKFDRLEVLERVNNETGNRYKWKCLCDCGNTVLVSPQNLKNGHTKSCGCLQRETAVTSALIANATFDEKYRIEGTNIARIAKEKPDKSNTSGYAGVCFHKQSQKWEARIGFKGTRYDLGRYKNIDDAVKARQEAENHYYSEFLEWYENEYKKNKKD